MKRKSILLLPLIVFTMALAGCKRGKKVTPQETEVIETIPVESVALNKSSADLLVGNTLTLTATITPSNATNKAVSWSSSDAAVASVKDGVVKGEKVGKATITVKTADGNKSASCLINVKANVPTPTPTNIPVESVSLDQKDLHLNVGDYQRLAATVLPADATNKSVGWSVTDPEIISVDNGLVTALAEGQADVTVTTVDGGKTANCHVVVEAQVVPPTPQTYAFYAVIGENEFGLELDDSAVLGDNQLAEYRAEVGTVTKGQSIAILGEDKLALSENFDAEGGDNNVDGVIGAYTVHNDAQDAFVIVKVYDTPWVQFYLSGYEKGQQPQPEEKAYYLKGTMNDWTEDEDYLFVVDQQDPNHYSLEAELAADDELKVYEASEGLWFSNASTWDDCGFTLNEEGNVKVIAEGEYVINFYVEGENDNHIVLVKQGGGEEPPVEKVYTVTFGEGEPIELELDELNPEFDGTATFKYSKKGVDVKKGDAIKFALNGNEIKPGPDSGSNSIGTWPEYTVHNDAEAAEIYLKGYGDGGHSFYISGYEEEPPVEPGETLYYLVGSFNEWKDNEQYLLTVDAEDANHYSIEIELEAEAELKVHSNKDDWFSSASTWENCGFTLNEGNVKVIAAGEYIINFYVESDNHNHIVPALQGGQEEPPVEPEETLYYLVGSFNEWEDNEEYLLVADAKNENHYSFEIELEAETELKVHSNKDDWFSNESTWDGCGFTLNEGNVKVTAAGEYVIHFYVEGENNNHIVPALQGGQEEPPVEPEETLYYLVGSFNEWTDSEDYLLVADAENENHYSIQIELEAEAELKIHSNKDGWFSNESTWDDCGFTLNEGNVKLSATGEYIINFYVEGENNNHIVPALQGGQEEPPVEPEETLYYLVGSFNEWKDNEEYLLTVDAEDANHYSIEIELEAEAELKVHSNKDGWFSNASTWDGCGFIIHEENVKVLAAGEYIINFYVEGENNNHIVPALQGGQEEPPVEPEETLYYLVGSFNEWKDSEDYLLVADKENENHYSIQIELEAEAELKVHSNKDGWFSNESTWDDCGFTLNEGNVKVTAAGEYVIHFYVEGENNNHIVPALQGGQEEPPVEPEETLYYLVGSFNEWTDSEDYLLAADKENENHYSIEIELEAEAELKVHSTKDDWYSCASTWDNCGFTLNDGNIKLNETGKYVINLYLDGQNNNFIVPTLQAEQGGEQGGQEQPQGGEQDENVIINVALGEWANDKAVIFAWVWGENVEGEWVKVVDNKIEAKAGVDSLILVRMPADSAAANWDTCWNRTNNIAIEEGTLTFVNWAGAANGYSTFSWVL